jgi:hypothetical protein
MELLSKRFKLLAKEYGSEIDIDIIDLKDDDGIKETMIQI